MADPYQPNIPYVEDGEAVAQSITNRPTRALARNIGYLKDRVDLESLGEALVAYDRTVSASSFVGQPMAVDPSTGEFVPAIAEVVVDQATGIVGPSFRSQCVGILVAKGVIPESGDILLSGALPIDLSAAVGSTPTPGLYYLSATTPGKLVRQQPAIAAPVLFFDGEFAYFSPTLRDFAGGHVHFSVDLACAPAGGNAVSGGRRSVSSPDATKQGWLPANHPAFNGAAPSGAAFGYNIARHPTLAAIWPPVPIRSVNLWWDKGDSDSRGASLLRGGLNGRWFADATTIWWMSDCDGEQPWPSTYNAGSPPGPLPDGTTPPTCPPPRAMRILASFTEMLADTSHTAVTSLSSPQGSPVSIVGPGGDPATTGDLVIDVDADLLLDDGIDEPGGLAIKALRDGKLFRGPVISDVVEGPGISITKVDGVATLSAVTDPAGRELAPQVVKLDNAIQRDPGGLLYYGMPAGRASGLRFMFQVPNAGLPQTPTVALRFIILGTAAGTLPALTLTRRILPRPATNAVVTPTASDTTVAITTAVAIGAGQYAERQATAFSVAAGDTLLVSLSRGASDGYGGEVGIVRASAIILG